MIRHFSFPSIDQFRTVVKHVNDRCNYSMMPKPTLTFHGSVKLHGTNSSIVYTQDDELYAQSRSNVITPEADNAGFATWVHSNKDEFAHALSAVLSMGKAINPEIHSVAIYGEWCGKGIQKGVAVSQLPKMFVIFAIRLIADGMVKENGELVPGVVSTWLKPNEVKATVDEFLKAEWLSCPVFCIEDFPTWDVEIDFVNPAEVQNKLGELTLAVERQCPVGAVFGASGVGEGIVWVCTGSADIPVDDLIFKVKGEKHSDTKVTTLAAVDIEKVNSIRQCAETVVTTHRLEKGIAYLREQHPNQDVNDNQHIGEFLQWVARDIIKEESDTITGNGLQIKDVMKSVNTIAKNWFLNKRN